MPMIRQYGNHENMTIIRQFDNNMPIWQLWDNVAIRFFDDNMIWKYDDNMTIILYYGNNDSMAISSYYNLRKVCLSVCLFVCLLLLGF